MHDTGHSASLQAVDDIVNHFQVNPNEGAYFAVLDVEGNQKVKSFHN